MIRTAGLNKPPLMRKKTQTVTASENPKAREMYINDARSMFELPLIFRTLFATWVPAKAKNRKRNVPTSSPRNAISRWRILSGSLRRLCCRSPEVGPTEYLVAADDMVVGL